MHLEQLGDATEEMLLHALVLEIVCPIHRLAQIHTAQKIMVGFGHRTQCRIQCEILQIALDYRIPLLEHFHQVVFTLNESVHHLIHRSGRGVRLGIGLCRP